MKCSCSEAEIIREGGECVMKKWTREERYRVLKSPDEIRELHDRTVQSDYRQTYHIQSVTGLLNDPNGFVWHDGKWHLFYQWCPWGAVHGLKYWYQTVSKDLVTWENVGVCIRPDMDMDNAGAYSGSALPGKDALCLFYSGNRRDENWVRVPNTCTLKLYDNGKVVKLPWPIFGPNPNYTEHQRDPKIIYNKEMKKYFIILGAQTKDKRGCAIIYRSNELQDGWEFAGELKVPGFENFGDMWECPAIESIGDYDVFLFCPQHLSIEGRGGNIHHNGYLVGKMNWETLTFEHDNYFHFLDFGFDSYAAECANNMPTEDNAVLVAWMGLPDTSYPTDEEEWSGCLTLPRELLMRDRRLIQRPLPALAALRDGHADLSDGKLPRACEIEIFCQGDVELRFFAKADGSGGYVFRYDDEKQVASVDKSGMTQRYNQQLGEKMDRPLANPLTHLRIFIDRSSIEIFANDGDGVFSSRIFPVEGEERLVFEGQGKMEVWNLRPAIRDEFVV